MQYLLKKITLMSFLFIFILSIYTSFSAALPKTAFEPFTPIDMSSGPNHYGGNYYIFSDFPETIDDSQFNGGNAGRYTISRPVSGGHDYVVEYFHFNGAKQDLRIGVALLNKSGSACTVTVKNIAQDNSISGFIKEGSRVQRNYQASTNISKLNVPGRKNNIAGCAVVMDQPFPDTSVANGKVKIYVPAVSNLEIRVFFIQDKADKSNIVKCKECDPGKDIQRTAGMYSCDARYITFDTNVPVKTFYLGFVNDHYNPNEYEPSICPVRGRSVIEGNYGITYDIVFTNREKSLVNSLRITPQWKYIDSDHQEYVVNAGSGWTIIHIDDKKDIVIPIPESGEIKFILPGCGCGNICFDLIHSDNKIEFWDVYGEEAGYISFLASRGIVKSGFDGAFNPNADITRAEFAQTLANMAAADLAKYKKAVFIDVKVNDPYNGAVQWANEKGIIPGSKGRFNPNGGISCQDMAVMLVRYAEKIGGYRFDYTGKTPAYSDSSSIAVYAKASVAVLQNAGVLPGKSTDAFCPKVFASKAQAARVVAALLKLLNK